MSAATPFSVRFPTRKLRDKSKTVCPSVCPCPFGDKTCPSSSFFVGKRRDSRGTTQGQNQQRDRDNAYIICVSRCPSPPAPSARHPRRTVKFTALNPPPTGMEVFRICSSKVSNHASTPKTDKTTIALRRIKNESRPLQEPRGRTEANGAHR
jgi:hypothetical protein